MNKFIFSVAEYRKMVILTLITIPTGAVIGLIEVLFGKGLSIVTGLRNINPLYFIPVLPFAGVLIAYVYKKIGKKSIKGMGIVFGAAASRENIPARMVPIVMSASWITHLFGGSAGREGVAVQIGAAVSDQIGRRIHYKDAKESFIVAGMAAGFAGLFQTPMAALFFALEGLEAGKMKYKALVPAMACAYSSYSVANFFGLHKFYNPISIHYILNGTLVFKLGLLGLLFGVLGALFAKSLEQTKILAKKKIQNPLKRIFIMAVPLAVLLMLTKGRYSGFGTEITVNAVTTGQVFYWDFALKAIFTIITLAAGFQGGELTPIFAIGSSFGAVIAPLFGLDPVFVAAIGYSAMFGSATNTLLAPILIGGECFGYNNVSYLVIVCAIAYVFNFNQSIYSAQKKQHMLR